MLRKKVQAVLDGNVHTREYGLKADVVDGKARVTGVVDTLAEREQVRQLVSRLNGIRAVENGVAVSTDGAITDDDVTFEVAEELAADPEINHRGISAKSVKGVVYLQGTVDSEEEQEAALAAATRARGVKEVISRLKVSRPGAYDTDNLEEIFHHQVNNDYEDEDRPGVY
ncbi:transporter [Desulfotomaculum copahuensis]|uniref:Transporter n=2 Tax=Desulfotomaculum copahuensis TaxID=1838280 RepID=A0A1B7LDR9_9FIRM|nr:transporter [Desulfotomaculum copahuensis]